MIDDDISVSVIQVSGRTVKIGIDYPKHIKVYRKEIYDRIVAENGEASNSDSKIFSEISENLKIKNVG